jgi:hypothetical protein
MIPVALLEPMTEFGIEIFHTFEAFSQIQWNLSNLDPEYIRILKDRGVLPTSGTRRGYSYIYHLHVWQTLYTNEL